MPLFERILCPIDFSEFSVRAYDYAQSLAWHYQADLFLQHVLYWYPAFYTDDAYREARQSACADALRKVEGFAKHQTRTKVQPRCVVQEGDTTDQILLNAEAQGVDLIVMGTHGLRGVDRLMLGSVTERVLRKARCPVLAVRKPAHDFVSSGQGGDPVNVRKILLCMDFSDHARHASRYALSIAREYNAELTLLHVLQQFPASPDAQGEIAKVVEQLESSVPSGEWGGFPVRPLARIGVPYEQIIQLAIEAQTDLVIMGVRGRGAVDIAVFGSTTYRVLQLGPCPVLAVHI
jgi:nucleotide-binding universal stress UspA family protein